MRRGRSTTELIWRYDGTLSRRPDVLVVEEPLSIRLDDVLVATTMRTPGDDFELAVGFCHAEGMFGGAAIATVRYCATGSAFDTDYNVVSVETVGRQSFPRQRLGTTSSSCGLCGAEAIDELTARLAPVVAEAFPADVLVGVPEAVSAHQALFDATGAVHAAAAFDRSGAVTLVREDIGRHNAVDKVVGRLLLDGALPATELGLYVSGRASFEMVQKAWAAGFGTVVAVSAPSALAVETAKAAGMQLAGFARGTSLNFYSSEPMRPTDP